MTHTVTASTRISVGDCVSTYLPEVSAAHPIRVAVVTHITDDGEYFVVPLSTSVSLAPWQTIIPKLAGKNEPSFAAFNLASFVSQSRFTLHRGSFFDTAVGEWHFDNLITEFARYYSRTFDVKQFPSYN